MSLCAAVLIIDSVLPAHTVAVRDARNNVSSVLYLLIGINGTRLFGISSIVSERLVVDVCRYAQSISDASQEIRTR